MTPAGLALLGLSAWLAFSGEARAAAPPAATPPAVPPAGPAYTRPVSPEDDLRRLRDEIAAGQPDAAFWHARLETYLALGELPTIPELVTLMASAFPQDPAFQEGRMMFLSLAGEHAAAIAAGEDILRRFPDYRTIRANLGRVYIESGDRARGVNLLIAALEQGPIRVEDWRLLLEALGVAGDKKVAPEKVLATLREKIAANPQRPSLRYLLMVVLTRFGRYQEARQILADHPELAAHPDLEIFVEHTAGPPAILRESGGSP